MNLAALFTVYLQILNDRCNSHIYNNGLWISPWYIQQASLLLILIIIFGTKNVIFSTNGIVVLPGLTIWQGYTFKMTNEINQIVLNKYCSYIILFIWMNILELTMKGTKTKVWVLVNFWS